jgi:hypothetical protein
MGDLLWFLVACFVVVWCGCVCLFILTLLLFSFLLLTYIRKHRHKWVRVKNNDMATRIQKSARRSMNRNKFVKMIAGVRTLQCRFRFKVKRSFRQVPLCFFYDHSLLSWASYLHLSRFFFFSFSLTSFCFSLLSAGTFPPPASSPLCGLGLP